MALRNESAALQGVTCCCLVSVCFFSTLISLKIFNSKTLEASRTERNWQSQLRAGFGAVAALSWEGGAWEKHAFGKMCNRVLLHFSLEQLLLNSVHSSSMCCSLKGRSKSYNLLFIFCSGFLCSPRVMGPCSGFPAGLVLLVKPKVKAGTELPSSHGDPAHNSRQPFLPNTEASSHLTFSFLSLCPPASPKVLTPAAVPVLPAAPSAQSSLLHHQLHLLSSCPPTSPHVMTSKPFSCLIPAPGCCLAASSASTPLHMIQLYFSPLIKQNGQMGAEKSL